MNPFTQLQHKGPFGSATDFLGLALFLVGSATETISELQRKAFKVSSG